MRYLISLVGSALLLALLNSCGSIRLKPRKVIKPESDCFRDAGTLNPVFSQLEEDMHRSGALETRTIVLKSDFGMIERTAKIYILNRKKYILVLHFMHAVELEFKDYSLTIRNGSKAIAKGLLQVDTKYSIGRATDEYLYYPLSEDQAKEIAGAENVTVMVGGLSFDIPYDCRDTFRSALNTR